MIRHVWTVLCSSASIDRDTNNISLFEVIEQLNVQGDVREPVIVPRPFEIVSLWTRIPLDQPARREARYRLRTPGGRDIPVVTQELDLRQYRRLRTRSRLPALPVDQAGLYSFVVEYREQDRDWSPAAEVPLDVQVSRPAGGEPG